MGKLKAGDKKKAERRVVGIRMLFDPKAKITRAGRAEGKKGETCHPQFILFAVETFESFCCK